MMNIQPAPNRLMPNFANVHGVQTTPMQMYCTQMKLGDKLPRGMESKCYSLRRIILKKIREPLLNFGRR